MFHGVIIISVWISSVFFFVYYCRFSRNNRMKDTKVIPDTFVCSSFLSFYFSRISQVLPAVPNDFLFQILATNISQPTIIISICVWSRLSLVFYCYFWLPRNESVQRLFPNALSMEDWMLLGRFVPWWSIVNHSWL